MPSQNVMQFAQWLRAYDPGFYGYVVGMAAETGQLNGLGAVATVTAAGASSTAAQSSIWDKISGSAAGFSNTLTSLANSYYGYKTQKAVVSAAAKAAEQSAPINAQNAVPVMVPEYVKSAKSTMSELAIPIAGGAMIIMALLVASKSGGNSGGTGARRRG